MQDQTFPYNRIVQWAAGPVSTLAGLACAWLGTKFGLIRSHQNQAVHDLSALGMTAIGAAVTYAAHHKWLTNVAHYMFAQEAAAATVGGDSVDPTADEPADVAGIDSTDVLPSTGDTPAVTETVPGPPPISSSTPPVAAPPSS